MPFCSGFVMRNIYDKSGNRIGSMSLISKVHWGRFYDTAECLNSNGASYNFQYDRPIRQSNKPLFWAIAVVFSIAGLFHFISSDEYRAAPRALRAGGAGSGLVIYYNIAYTQWSRMALSRAYQLLYTLARCRSGILGCTLISPKFYYGFVGQI